MRRMLTGWAAAIGLCLVAGVAAAQTKVVNEIGRAHV